MNTFNCQQCTNKFERQSKGDRVHRFCSLDCYGLSKRGRTAWNKGKPSPWAGANGFKKGSHPSPATEFKKGQTLGEKNIRWKGGSYVTENGYVHILSKGHPNANIHGRVPEQVLIAERCLGRYLTKDEIVHHSNQVKTDNRPVNLYVFPSKVEHARHHMNLLLGKEQSKTSNL